MQELTGIIERATAEVEGKYFQLEIADGDPVYRERVYCYELYHQLRRLWPEKSSEYYLMGEVDKAAHPILKELGADGAKPDLLVHKPAYMTGNHAVIEVKSPGAKSSGILTDLEKLSLFRTSVRYQRAIYLLFGWEAEETSQRVVALAAQLQDLPPIELWIHCEVGQPAKLKQTLGLR